MLGKKLGVDLGTGTIRITARGEGTLVVEPSVVAVRNGTPAMSMLGLAALEAAADDASLTLRRPLRGGDVSDREALGELLRHAVSRAVGRQRIFKPDLVVAVRSGLGGEDRRAVLDAAARAGARTVYLIDAAIAAALGAGIEVTSPRARLVIDIGAGKSDLAVLALEGTIVGRSLGCGADDLFDHIATHVLSVHGVRLSLAELHGAARLLVAASHEERTAEVGGVLLSSRELTPLVADHLRALDAALLEVLEEAPATVRRDVTSGGVLLTGGGARLEGLGRHLGAIAGCAVSLAADPQGCALRGAALAVENLDVLRRNFMYMR